MSSAFLCRTVSSCGRRVGEPTRKGLKMHFCPKVFNRSLVSNMSNYVHVVIKIHICRSFVKILAENSIWYFVFLLLATICNLLEVNLRILLFYTGLVLHKMYTVRCDHCMWSSCGIVTRMKEIPMRLTLKIAVIS